MARELNRLGNGAGLNKIGAGMHADGGGLYLRVSTTGGRSWVFVYALGGRRVELGLGALRVVGLKDAREKASEHRLTLANGGDPKVIKLKGAGVPTLQGALDEYVIAKGSSRALTTVRRWKSIIRLHSGEMRTMRTNDITANHVSLAMKKLWPTPSATMLRVMIETLIDFVRVKYDLPDVPNPARWDGNLEHLMPAVTHEATNYPAMPWADVPAFWQKLSPRDSNVARLLAFQILTATRPSEPRLMGWDEIDFEAKVWTIPAERTKKRRLHRVPLSETALAILAHQKKLYANHKFVFPGEARSYSGSISHWGTNQLMTILKAGMFTPHGFRSSFRDYMAEAHDFPTEVLERCLAHVSGDKSQRAYDRTDLLDKRRPVMDAWERHVISGHR